MVKGGYKYKKATVKRSKKKSGKKIKINSFFKKTIKAKKENKTSFEHNGFKYVRKTKGPLVFYAKA
tara:strand:+ start:214 stop:411 length:198 start_codon:yes stop_codon:yes gene_type:complete